MSKRGPTRKLNYDDTEDIKRLYYHETAPNGKSYSMPMLSKLFRVSEATINKVLKDKYF